MRSFFDRVRGGVVDGEVLFVSGVDEDDVGARRDGARPLEIELGLTLVAAVVDRGRPGVRDEDVHLVHREAEVRAEVREVRRGVGRLADDDEVDSLSVRPGGEERVRVVEGGEVGRAEGRLAEVGVLRRGTLHRAERRVVEPEVVEAVEAEDDGSELRRDHRRARHGVMGLPLDRVVVELGPERGFDLASLPAEPDAGAEARRAVDQR